MSHTPLRMFEAFGVELEYMIVDLETLDIRPICDQLMEAVSGATESEVDLGETAWSNELVLHVLEMKTNGPARSLELLPNRFQLDVQRANNRLESLGACLMPTAMHPWMNPATEMKLWPHEYGEIYQTYDRIFDCRGHGWSNLQSTHINLPFDGEEEFGRLHAAIRLILPILPAIASSSPIVEMKATGSIDNRLEFYRTNQKKVPIVAGQVIPEALYTKADYDREIFDQIEKAIAPLDPEGILEKQFLNSRGAIARFERGAIEIRLLDIQEFPGADLAILALIVKVLRALVGCRWTETDRQMAFPTERLASLFTEIVKQGDVYTIEDLEYLEMFGVKKPISAGDLWKALHEGCPVHAQHRDTLDKILKRGPLARAILKEIGDELSRDKVAEVYRELCRCLDERRLFGC